MGVKVYKAKVGREIEGRDKKVWEDVGFTLFYREDNDRMTLRDDRTGSTYLLFWANKPKDDRPAPEKTKQGFEDDIPF